MSDKHIILYAEDDADDVFMVTKAFERHDDIEVKIAGNGWEVLQMLTEMEGNGSMPCLVILDINMPVMSGKEALLKIREQEALNEVPVVLFSTSSSKTDQAFAAAYNVELFTKPLHFGDLEKITAQFVERCNFKTNAR